MPLRGPSWRPGMEVSGSRRAGGLNQWQNGQITTFDRRDGKLNGVAARSLFQDARGRMWVSTPREFGYLESDRFIPVKGVPGGVVHGIAEDTAGNLWIANQDAGLFQLFRGNVVQQIPWARLGHKESAIALAADPVRGGLWLGFFQGGIAYFSDGQVRASYSAADGLGEGHVSDLRLDHDGTLWAATEGGLSRLKDGRIATLRSSNGLPCDGGVLDDGRRRSRAVAVYDLRPGAHCALGARRLGWLIRSGRFRSPFSTSPTEYGSVPLTSASVRRSPRPRMENCGSGLWMASASLIRSIFPSTTSAAGTYRADHRRPQDLRCDVRCETAIAACPR